MKINGKISKILSFPACYRLFQRMVGAESSRKTFLVDYVKPSPGNKILDIGCGPGDILEQLTDVDYTGLDISPEYISAAKQRYGSRGRFCCGDVGLATIEGEQESFDLVLAVGVIHHLDDSQAAKLFTLARRVLRPGGRLITYDGCYVPKQSTIARWLLAKDRGKFVRTQKEYQKLASTHFGMFESHLRHDLLRIPYTHLIMNCSG